ncbi:ras and EF-hand domain-containing protein homolog [Labrus mixtus]|uniref:ras and EF-hand domain-containing protein homolog n=1 Tax=Labrus mixtus TaxID=508554 RepID=UPI0029C0069B|nr:ras and EF-hand domain-containing protein homolog [Labrus mixtus]
MLMTFQSSSCDKITEGPDLGGSSDPLEQEDDYHNQNKEALSYDKEEKSDMQKTNDAVETVGHITIDDHNREASTVAGSVSEKDEVDGKLKDSMRTDQQAQDNMASQDITESEFFAKHKTDSLVPLDTGLVVNSKAEQAVDVAEEIGTDQEKFKQRKRKFGSNRRTLHKVNPERGQENKDESKRVEFKTEPEVRDFEKKEVMDEFPALATADVSMNEKGKPSLSLVCIPQSKTDETSSVLDLGQMLQSRYSDPKALESSTIPDKNLLLSSNTEECTNIGITGGSFVSLDETTQGSQNDEERPESANALQQQALKSTEKQVVAVEDLEIVKAVVIGGEEEQNNVKPSMQESSNVEEGAQKTDLEMKNASPNLNSTQPRRKLGSTRKNLRSKTKDEELPQKQEVDDKAIETTTNAEDVKTNFVSGIQEEELKLPVEQEDIDSVQKKDRVLETVEYSHTGESHLTPKAHQTSEENPVSGSESEHQQAPNYHLPIPSTTPKEDVMSESAAGGRKRKMGSNRKSRGQQKNREETAREDHIINKENGSDGGSVTDESAVKTVEEELLGLHETSGIEKTNKKESPNSRTSKAGGDTKPVSEKKPEQQTPVQRPSADIRLGQEGHQTFSLAGDSSVDRSNSYNVVMVGDSSVGKTSFMKRAQSGKFSLDIPASIGVDCCLWTVVVDGKPVVLQLWDTAGQERFHSITRQIFHKAQAFLLMYDISSAYSFSAVSYWASCIQEGAPENVTVLLVGNKSDHAERRVKTQEGETLAKEYNFEFMECSAATGENVIESLETMARMLSQKIGTREEATLSFKEPQKKKSSGCC